MQLFRELERLALVNKLCTELSNHFGSDSEHVVDKDVAEFIIHLAEKNADVDTFRKELTENGAEFSESFITNIHRLIHAHFEKAKQKKVLESKSEQKKSDILTDVNGEKIDVDPSLLLRETFNQEMKQKFPGLCIKDDIPSAKKLQHPEEGAKNREKVLSTMGQLEALRKKSARIEKDENLKSRERHRDRSRSPNGSRHRNRERFHSPSPTRPRHRRGDKNRRDSRDRRRDKREESPVDLEPVSGSIYKGNVTGVLKYGCFVSLRGVKGRWEGLVHISQMLGGGVRVSEPQEVVSRGDSVFVKVLNITGEKMRLSMKEACQKTGKDLGGPKPSAVTMGGEIGRPFATHNPEGSEDDDDVSNSANRAWTGGSGRKRARCSSPEKWELKQLVAAGVMELEDLPWYDEETGVLREDADDSDEEIEIGELSGVKFIFIKLQVTPLNRDTLVPDILSRLSGVPN